MSIPAEKERILSYSSTASLEAQKSSQIQDSIARFEKENLAYKRRIRILRLISRITSLILSSIVIGCLSYSLAKYFLTRGHKLPDGAHTWITPMTLWPTEMLLAIAGITFIMNFFTLCTYMCGVGVANRLSTATTVIEIITISVRVVVWGIATITYKMAQTDHSLWGYSCNAPNETATLVESFLNFGKLCYVQSSTWYIAILEFVAYLLTFIIYAFVLKRRTTKKKIARARSGLSMDGGFAPTAYMGSQPRYTPVSGDSSHV